MALIDRARAKAAGRPGIPSFIQTGIQKKAFILAVLIPYLAGYLLFTIYPNIVSVYYSLLRWDGIAKPAFIGLENFVKVFQDQYVWRALYHNLILLLAVPPITVLLSLVLAYVLVNRRYAENKFHKVIFFLPNVMSTVIIALMWSFIYDGDFGILNALLRAVGIPIGKFYWLGDTNTALAAVMVPMIWGSVGFYVIIFMNAMNSIPASLYDSAIIDGAGPMTILFRITLPLIWGVVRIALIFIILGLFKGFEILLVLTRGGPQGATDVIGLYMFTVAFGGRRTGSGVAPMYGYASAIGMLLFFILVGINLLMDKVFPNRRIEY